MLTSNTVRDITITICTEHTERMSCSISEANCGEIVRARRVYEIAVSQPSLDMPELLWKNYIDLEIGEGA
jgi:hypothetical protein